MPLELLKFLGPYLISVIAGACAAWYVQDVRIERARNDLVAYQQAATAEVQASEAKHLAINQEVGNAYAQNIMALRSNFAGTRSVLPRTNHSAPAVPDAAVGVDGNAANLRPADAGHAADETLTERCTETTLQLIYLQHWAGVVAQD